MHIRFIGHMMKAGYSGGRLLALGMAEATAISGHSVDFILDNLPEMALEFERYSKVNHIVADFNKLYNYVDSNVDIVIIVPSQGKTDWHCEWARHAMQCKAKIILINFETPNWFNTLLPDPRSLELWEGSDLIANYADMILSISAEGNHYAREYFSQEAPTCLFDYCYPGINTVLADMIPTPSKKIKRIAMLTRVDLHKGFDNFAPLLCPKLAGYEVAIHLGNGRVDKREIAVWEQRFSKYNMKFTVNGPIYGLNKFSYLKESSLLYFPTKFEGFGLPPLEAAYCKTACACSDLPVLREFGKDAFCYGNPDNTKSMQKAIINALSSQSKVLSEHPRISDIAKINMWGKRVDQILKKVCNN